MEASRAGASVASAGGYDATPPRGSHFGPSSCGDSKKVTATARAAEPGKETVLVVLEMTGGNNGLNTVVPYGDEHYHSARPTLRIPKEQVVRIDDYLGFNPGLRSFETLLGKGQLAIVQGVGYPNPDRSHFESMDIWQSADPRRQTGNGWLGRS